MPWYHRAAWRRDVDDFDRIDDCQFRISDDGEFNGINDDEFDEVDDEKYLNRRLKKKSIILMINNGDGIGDG